MKIYPTLQKLSGIEIIIPFAKWQEEIAHIETKKPDDAFIKNINVKLPHRIATLKNLVNDYHKPITYEKYLGKDEDTFAPSIDFSETCFCDDFIQYLKIHNFSIHDYQNLQSDIEIYTHSVIENQCHKNNLFTPQEYKNKLSQLYRQKEQLLKSIIDNIQPKSFQDSKICFEIKYPFEEKSMGWAIYWFVKPSFNLASQILFNTLKSHFNQTPIQQQDNSFLINNLRFKVNSIAVSKFPTAYVKIVDSNNVQILLKMYLNKPNKFLNIISNEFSSAYKRLEQNKNKQNYWNFFDFIKKYANGKSYRRSKHNSLDNPEVFRYSKKFGACFFNAHKGGYSLTCKQHISIKQFFED